jgi:predicted TIM-barrel fold metal-dependent hydrolase
MEVLAKKVEELGFDYAVVCSSGLAQGEDFRTLEDAKSAMERIAWAQNNPGAVSISGINAELKKNTAPFKRLIPFAKADLFRQTLAEDVRSAADLGFAGIGEVVGIHGNIPALSALFAALDGTGLPVFIHCDYPVDVRDIKEVFALAKKHPLQQVIVGHLGGDFYLDAISAALETENTVLDISETVNESALQVAANTLPERLVFGSDYPWDSPECILERVKQLTNSPSVKEGILGNTMQRILGIRQGGSHVQ